MHTVSMKFVCLVCCGLSAQFDTDQSASMVCVTEFLPVKPTHFLAILGSGIVKTEYVQLSLFIYSRFFLTPYLRNDQESI